MNQPGFIVLWSFAAILCRIQSLNRRRRGLVANLVVCADRVCTMGSCLLRPWVVLDLSHCLEKPKDAR